MIALFNGVPISVELPQRVALEIVETEPSCESLPDSFRMLSKLVPILDILSMNPSLFISA